MTDQEINIAVARICGWSQCEPKAYGYHTVSHAFIKDGAYYGGINSIPDYCNDLNAIHEAVMSLPPEMRSLFRKELQYTIAPKTRPGPVCQVVLMDVDSYDAWFHSSARLRAEALVKVLNIQKP